MAALLSTSLWTWLLLLGGGTLYWAACLLRNYLKARKIGLPIKVIPIDHMNPLWVVLDRKIVPIVKRLPFGLGDNSFTRYNWRGFEREDKTRSHDEMGDAFVIVSPRFIWLYINDPDTVMDCLRRKSDFKHPIIMTEMLGIFGTNLSVVEGPEWKLHRRITASCFNDQNNQIVWSEGLTLASDMLRYWLSKPAVTTTADDTRTLSLHIMTRAGFGKSFKFVGHDERSELSTSVSYKSSLQTILEDCVLIMVLGRKFLSNPWLPRRLRSLGEACTAFQAHMTDMYETEKRALASSKGSGAGGDRNLMTQLVRASQDHAGEGGLTESEIYGNMFVFNFAGHDTTTHTLNFALFFLAAHPDVQDWLAEEIRAVVGDTTPASDWDFTASFPRLRRCLAVLVETLRLFPPVGTAKWTDEGTTTLTVHNNSKTVVLPPKTMVISNSGDLHVNPKYWGPDPLVWRPNRWIKAGGVSGDEEFIPPRRGTFLSWSEGPRDCPGRKFAQVEVVAALAVLLRDARVDPLKEKGETAEKARERVLRFIDADATHVLLLQLTHPERVPLVWSRR